MSPFGSRVSRSILALLAAIALVVVMRPVSVRAGSLAPSPGSTGYDASFPQCGLPLPTDGSIAIVGVTGGRPWSANPCLAQEYAWAASRGYSALYMNTANPAPTSSFYWPQSGASDPALCIDSTSTTDPGCAYDYGWHAAADALTTARAAIGPAAATLPWWLDVEITNSWNGDGFSNAADIQGMIDDLRSNGVPSVGIYSTGEQWATITWGYTVLSSPAYASRWLAEFVPRAALSESPDWIAGASSLTDTAASCREPFSGGVAQLAQYGGAGISADFACLPPPPSHLVLPAVARDAP